MMAPADFFLRLGLPAPSDSELAGVGILDSSKPVTNTAGGFVEDSARQGLYALMRSRENDILNLANQERATLDAYFDDIRIGENSFGIVDLGWHASSVRSIRRLLHAMGKSSDFQSYYFCTWRYAQPAIDEGCSLESFYCHLHSPEMRASLLAESVELIELFFADSIPSIVGVEKKGDSWQPICGEPELSDEHQRCIDQARAAAFEFVDDLLPHLPPPEDHPQASGLGYLDAVLERVLRNPLPEEAAELGDLSLRNSFGGKGPLRFLAKVSDDQGRPLQGKALQDAFDHCYWKKGFIARLNQKQRAFLGIA